MMSVLRMGGRSAGATSSMSASRTSAGWYLSMGRSKHQTPCGCPCPAAERGSPIRELGKQMGIATTPNASGAPWFSGKTKLKPCCWHSHPGRSPLGWFCRWGWMKGHRKGETHGITRVNPLYVAGLGDRSAGVLSLLLRGGMCLPPGLLHERHQPCHPAVPGQCKLGGNTEGVIGGQWVLMESWIWVWGGLGWRVQFSSSCQ